mmetsp:Transcript_8976/g.11674  ORF Transcript_8976/g.11674 Transcript_8976/m.11674 type:complete len:118 (+) Transcript_8976:173-526(+)
MKSLAVGIQCKNSGKKVGVSVLRDLEGSIQRYAGEKREAVLGILVSSSGFTRNSWQHAFTSSNPLMLMQIDNGNILQVRFSQTVAQTFPAIRITKQRVQGGHTAIIVLLDEDVLMVI